MLTGSSNFRLLSTGAWDPLCSASLNRCLSACHFFLTCISMPWSVVTNTAFVLLISCFYSYSFLFSHMPPFMSLSHTFSPPTETLPPLRELFVSPCSFLENRHVFFPLNPLNSVHLSHVKDNIPPVVVIVVFVFSS